jgi:hypothetical protein
VRIVDTQDLQMLEPDPRLEVLRGSYRGRVWMIGNGLSLSCTPLEKLVGEKTFAMNAISLMYPKTPWRPSFYFCISSNVVAAHRLALFRATVDAGIPSFLSATWRNTVFQDAEHIYWLHSLIKGVKEETVWSKDVSRLLGRCHTSMYGAMQIASYLGFDELYLLGCDMGWKPLWTDERDENHFDVGYSIGAKLMSDVDAKKIDDGMLEAHANAKEATDALGIKVFNATLGGELEIYPRVSMDEIL